MQELIQRFEPAHNLPLYLKSVQTSRKLAPDGNDGNHSSFFWIQSKSRQGTIQFNDQAITLTGGQGILLYGADNANYRIHSTDCLIQLVTFGGALALSLLSSFQLAPGIYAWDDYSALSGFLQHSWESALMRDDFTDLEGSNLIYTFLILLKKCGGLPRPVVATKRIHKFEQLLCHLQSEYANPEIGIETMAGFMDVSPQHLHVMFKKHTSMSPYAYLLHLRIDKSKELLLSTGYTVKQIAAFVGFRDVCHYIASFRKSTGLSPEKYRGQLVRPNRR